VQLLAFVRAGETVAATPSPIEKPMPDATLREAAEALGVSVRTMRRRVAEGKVSATKTFHGEREVWTIDCQSWPDMPKPRGRG